MKKFMRMCLAVALATMFLTACKGGDSSPTGPDGAPTQSIKNHRVTVNGTTMTVELSFKDGKVHRLVTGDQRVEEMEATRFVAFIWTGDSDNWQSTHRVNYVGGAIVTIGVPAHEAGNGYLVTADNQRFWLDLGQTDTVGCNIVFQREHTRHVIVW